MPFQTVVDSKLISGVIGEISHDGPTRAIPVILNTTAAENNVIGRAFTYQDKATERVQAGGTGTFAGIMINPKTHVNYGSVADPYSRSLLLPNGTPVELLQMGYVFVELTNDDESEAEIGAAVAYNNTTGELTAVADPSNPGEGLTLIPNCVVDRHNASEETPILAVIKLTN